MAKPAPAPAKPRRPAIPPAYGDPAKYSDVTAILEELSRLAFVRIGVRNRASRQWWKLKLQALETLARYHQLFRDPLSHQLEGAIRRQLERLQELKGVLEAGGTIPAGLRQVPILPEVTGTVGGADELDTSALACALRGGGEAAQDDEERAAADPQPAPHDNED